MKQQHLAAAICAALAIAIPAAAAAAKPDPNRMLVKYKATAHARARVEQALRSERGRIQLRLDKQRVIAVTLSPSAVRRLRANPAVESIEVDAPRYPLAQTTPWGIARVQAPEAVAAGADGSGIKVCVIDSGINASHVEFAGIAIDGYAPSGQAWNTDSCGHGTHVAGTIAAAGNGQGVVGVSPGKVALHIVKYFDGPSCGFSYSSNIIDAATRCQQAGARVINMSLGGPTLVQAEGAAFTNLYNDGVLSIASAGNDGDATKSYPASYGSVISVAATDQANAKATFSQYNNAVDLAAPGVGVLSTYPTRDAVLLVGGIEYQAGVISGSVQASASDAFVDGGRCATAGAWTNKIVLCERGDVTFAVKVSNVTTGNGRAAVIYNNTAGNFAGTLGEGVTSTIPAVSISQADGQFLVANKLGQLAAVTTVPTNNVSEYAYMDGTSMASPHVAGVAALVWSANPAATAQQVRAALTSSALDLGTAGLDNNFGHGLVRAADAVLALSAGFAPAATNLTVTVGPPASGRARFDLAWTGGATTIDILRDGVRVASAVSNTGAFSRFAQVRSPGASTYKVCNAGTTNCAAATANY